MHPATRDAYLRRLGVEPEPPSLDLLCRIHRAHVERVPYETLWIQLGQGWSVRDVERRTIERPITLVAGHRG